MENKALYHEVAIERENGSLDCLPATRYNFIAQTPTCPTHQLAPGFPTFIKQSMLWPRGIHQHPLSPRWCATRGLGAGASRYAAANGATMHPQTYTLSVTHTQIQTHTHTHTHTHRRLSRRPIHCRYF